jgi:uncharacterized protein
MKRIPRNIYLKRLIESQDNGLVKIITGIRRCGKSYLLFELFHDYLVSNGCSEDHIIEYSLDDLGNEGLREPHAMLAAIKSRIVDRGKYYVFLDEVQLIENFESLLNTLLHLRNVEVYVTGSNSRFLSHDIVTDFRGRGLEIRMHPLCFREFSSVYEGSLDQCWDDFFNYGGMPLTLSFAKPEQKMDYLEQLFRLVYESDIRERHRIRNGAELDDLLNILASAVGSLTNLKKLSDTFRSLKGKLISPKTLGTYIGYLEDSFLLDRALRYDVKGKKYISTPVKYYFEDVGLRNIRLGLRQQEENHVMENIIFNELKIRGCKVDVGVVPVREMDAEGKSREKKLEIDFVAYRGSQKYYIQSAFAMLDAGKEEQEKRPLIKVGDSFRKIVVVRDNIGVRRDEFGIATIGLRNFLLDPNSLEV